MDPGNGTLRCAGRNEFAAAFGVVYRYKIASEKP
jgi:hypothetical protein